MFCIFNYMSVIVFQCARHSTRNSFWAPTSIFRIKQNCGRVRSTIFLMLWIFRFQFISKVYIYSCVGKSSERVYLSKMQPIQHKPLQLLFTCTLSALELKDFNIFQGNRVSQSKTIKMKGCRRQKCIIQVSSRYGNRWKNSN